MKNKEVKYEEVSGISMASRKLPPYLLALYWILGIWAIGYALFAPGKIVVSEPLPVQADKGQKIAEGSCLSCHATGVAPDLHGVMERYKDEDIHQIIINGRNTMPAFGNRYTEEERKQIIAYLKAYQ